MGPPRYWKRPSRSPRGSVPGGTGSSGPGPFPRAKQSEKMDKKGVKRPRETDANDNTHDTQHAQDSSSKHIRSRNQNEPIYTRSTSPTSALASTSTSSNAHFSGSVPRRTIFSAPYEPTTSTSSAISSYVPYQSPLCSISSSTYKIDEPKQPVERVSRNFIDFSEDLDPDVDEGTLLFAKLATTSPVLPATTTTNLINTTIDLCDDDDDTNDDDSIQVLSPTPVATVSAITNPPSPARIMTRSTSYDLPTNQIQKPSTSATLPKQIDSTLLDISIDPLPPDSPRPSPQQVTFIPSSPDPDPDNDVEVIPIDLRSDDDDCKVVGIVTPTSNNHTRKWGLQRSASRSTLRAIKRLRKSPSNGGIRISTNNIPQGQLAHQGHPGGSGPNNKMESQQWSRRKKRKTKKRTNTPTTSSVMNNRRALVAPAPLRFRIPNFGVPQSLLPTKTYGKGRPMVIDGSNIACGYGKGKFHSKGIEICVRHLQHKPPFKDVVTNIKVFVPRHKSHSSSKSIDTDILLKLEAENILIFTPTRYVEGKAIVPYDDCMIMDYAAETGGIVISNDNFRDLFEVEDKKEWRETIKKRILPFTWVGEMLMFPTDPLGKNGPRLKDFIRFETGDPLDGKHPE